MILSRLFSQKVRFLVCFTAIALAPLLSWAQPDYPQAIWNQAYPGHWYTSGNGHSFCVIHDMEGYYESVISYFQASGTQASIHYCVNSLQNGNDPAHGYVENNSVDAPAGEITQMVREQYYAWHALCWNKYMFGTEHEGFVDSPAWYSEAMYQASAALQHSLCTRYSIPMDRNHIIGHNEWQNPTWTNWMAANWPQIGSTCNNHTDPGQYWDWTHFMQLVTGGGTNLPASIASNLFHKSADQGTSLTYSIAGNGTSPLNYRWLYNGAVIPGATSSNYTIANLQLSNAGNYSVIISNAYGSATSVVSVLTVNATQNWVTVFSDTLQNDTSANWLLFQGSGNGASDFTTNWAFDYTSATYTFNSVTNTIPTAPKTSNSVKRGLKITVNKNDTTAATSGVSLYPANQFFSGNYALRFDMWMNYSGGQGGGTGSTEYSTFGINHTGTRVNWGSGTAAVSDGIWFAVDGEGGATTDFLAYRGNSAGNPTSLSLAPGGFQANGALTQDSSDRLYVSIFPSGTYETPGAAGKHWVQGEVNQVNGVVTWKLNGIVVAERTNTAAYTNGNIMIGYMDIFTSISSPLTDNYVIFNNVQVLQPAAAPVFTVSPTPLTVTQGVSANAIFSAQASGVPAPAYQWRFNGTNIAGATLTNYTIASPQFTNAGNYSLIASNAYGSVTSSAVALTVYYPPSISSQPLPVTAAISSNAAFSVGATGNPTPTYYWRFNGTNLVATGIPTYGISNVRTTNAGNYSVLVSNLVGVVLSSNALLTVTNPQPQISGISRQTNGIITLQFSGQPACLYELDVSSNLVNWTVVSNISSGAGTFQFTDAGTNLGPNFYRLRWISD